MFSHSQTDETQDLALQRQIDENLKRVYRDTLSEALPDRFETLIERLREQDKEASKNA